MVIVNSAACSYYLQTRNSDKQTEINTSEFLTFVWLLSLKCHVCLSFVIKMWKMTKLRHKLQISHWCHLCTMLFSWNFSLNLSDLWTRQLANQSFEKSATLDNIYWPQLFKRWITLSTGEISVSWITQLLVSLIHWVVIYLVNSTIQLLNKQGLMY